VRKLLLCSSTIAVAFWAAAARADRLLSYPVAIEALDAALATGGEEGTDDRLAALVAVANRYVPRLSAEYYGQEAVIRREETRVRGSGPIKRSVLDAERYGRRLAPMRKEYVDFLTRLGDALTTQTSRRLSRELETGHARLAELVDAAGQKELLTKARDARLKRRYDDAGRAYMDLLGLATAKARSDAPVEGTAPRPPSPVPGPEDPGPAKSEPAPKAPSAARPEPCPPDRIDVELLVRLLSEIDDVEKPKPVALEKPPEPEPQDDIPPTPGLPAGAAGEIQWLCRYLEAVCQALDGKERRSIDHFQQFIRRGCRDARLVKSAEALAGSLEIRLDMERVWKRFAR